VPKRQSAGRFPPVSPAPAAKRRVGRILAALARAVPTPRVELSYANPWQLLVATILSAQCTDQRVNQVTPGLFRRYSGMGDLAVAGQAELEALVRPTGFFKSKARNLVACAKMLEERFGGKVPPTMEELVTLPGVGRKTANVVLGAWFGQPAIVVDTHVKRVAHRLGLTASDDPDIIESDLQALLPKPSWTSGSQRLLLHGRYVCVARKPKCGQCVVYQECRWKGKQAR
jgi:endonuclease-3